MCTYFFIVGLLVVLCCLMNNIGSLLHSCHVDIIIYLCIYSKLQTLFALLKIIILNFKEDSLLFMCLVWGRPCNCGCPWRPEGCTRCWSYRYEFPWYGCWEPNLSFCKRCECSESWDFASKEVLTLQVWRAKAQFPRTRDRNKAWTFSCLFHIVVVSVSSYM